VLATMRRFLIIKKQSKKGDTTKCGTDEGAYVVNQGDLDDILEGERTAEKNMKEERMQ
jgi:hypothetical protein